MSIPKPLQAARAPKMRQKARELDPVGALKEDFLALEQARDVAKDRALRCAVRRAGTAGPKRGTTADGPRSASACPTSGATASAAEPSRGRLPQPRADLHSASPELRRELLEMMRPAAGPDAAPREPASARDQGIFPQWKRRILEDIAAKMARVDAEGQVPPHTRRSSHGHEEEGPETSQRPGGGQSRGRVAGPAGGPGAAGGLRWPLEDQGLHGGDAHARRSEIEAFEQLLEWRSRYGLPEVGFSRRTPPVRHEDPPSYEQHLLEHLRAMEGQMSALKVQAVERASAARPEALDRALVDGDRALKGRGLYPDPRPWTGAPHPQPNGYWPIAQHRELRPPLDRWHPRSMGGTVEQPFFSAAPERWGQRRALPDGPETVRYSGTGAGAEASPPELYGGTALRRPRTADSMIRRVRIADEAAHF